VKVLSILISLLVVGSSPAQDGSRIDWEKARELLKRARSGQTLSPEEKTYLDHAKAVRRQPKLAPSETGRGNTKRQRSAPDRLIPLTELAEVYEGESGGLYSDGLNVPPESHQQSAKAQLDRITPLNETGSPSEDGKIVFISISMSNATQEFSEFVRIANDSSEKSDCVIPVDCAQGGQAMAQWAPPEARPWQVAQERLKKAGVTPAQVQVAWVKLANKSPAGSLQEHGKILEQDTLKVLQNAKAKFPNLRIAYLSSRIWAGNACSTINPEPYAYEGAFPTRWLIQRQIKGDSELTLDKTPLLLWGPYLWAEGERGRKVDDLVWLPEDFVADGVHPSMSGRRKVATLLLEFMTSDPLATPWFTGSP
jgi:hypothetical protein